MELEVKPYTLNFTFHARTSRGSMNSRDVWFLKISHQGKIGIGEVAPIRRLSPEDLDLIPEYLDNLGVKLMNVEAPKSLNECFNLSKDLVGANYPSVRFGLETALVDWMNKGHHSLFQNDFSKGYSPISINGLIWMNERDEMIRQVDEKLDMGFDCIKLKVGALDFQQELEVLKYLRDKAPKVTIRLDANGAFETNEVLKKLETLSTYGIHSIEQPIAPRQELATKLVIQKSPIPIAFDEELIGIADYSRKAELLDSLKPHYLVLKPTLLGGMQSCMEWIELAKERNIGWWVTSYLESNVGLNAIGQFTAEVDSEKVTPHGLGTGGLYDNNLHSPLEIKNGSLWIRSEGKWDSPFK